MIIINLEIIIIINLICQYVRGVFHADLNLHIKTTSDDSKIK